MAAPGAPCGWQPAQAYGHGARIFDLAFHPTEPGLLASASEDGTARVWRQNASSSAWQQANCCGSEANEMLRVAWSPDGAVLATGSADGIVRLWEVSEQGPSYSGMEVAALRGHPEEVYGIEFPATTRNKVVVASGESLFLWDLGVGRMVHEARPLAPGDEEAGPGPSSAAAAAADGAGGAIGSTNGGPAAAGGGADAPDSMPPYIFCLDQQQPAGGGLLAAACCDGVLRLWEVARQHLELVAEALVHPDDMGSACSFSLTQPHALAAISKNGQLTVVDVRKGGPALQQGQLEGPVLAARFVQLAGGHTGGAELLAVVGRDSRIRLYYVLAPGEDIGPPELCSAAQEYQGVLLALAASHDGSCLAAAGDAVPSEQLRPHAPAAEASTSSRATPSAPKGRRRRGAAVSLAAAGGDDLFGPLKPSPGGKEIADGVMPSLRPGAEHGSGHGHSSTGQTESMRAPIYVWCNSSC